MAPKTTSSGSAVEEVGHGLVRLLDDQVAALAGEKRSAEVGIPFRQVFRDSIDDLLRNLSPAGRVEEDGGLAVDRLAQSWKLLADPLNIEFADRGSDFCTRGHGYELLTALTKSESIP